MANAIGLGVQFTASASGMTKGLSQVDRVLQNLGKQASGAARLFDSFAGSSSAAAAAQQQVATDIAFLNSALKTGQVSAEQYATELNAITQAAQQQAAAFAEGARITAQFATAEEKAAASAERLEALLRQGAISEETYARAKAEASGANAAAAKAEQELAAAREQAARITAANLSPQQKYDNEVEQLNAHLAAGRISQETYNSALNKAANDFAKATIAANKYDNAAENAGDGGALKFNELSGVLSALPGPLGNVAGRMSGIASAGEGLSRIFSGGLSQGFASLGSTVAGLANPFTLAVAGVAAFGTAAVAVARGLADLEDRVEKLGNTADKLGVSFEFVQTLEESANRSGTSIDAVSTAFGRLQKSVLGVDEESKAAQKALAEIGVTSEQLASLSPEEQYRLIGSSLAEIEDPARRTATAIALFGKAGADLIPFFNNLGNAEADINRLGGALSALDRRRIDDFGAGLDALGVASGRLGELLLVPFVGLGEGVAQGSAEFLGGINAIVSVVGDVLEPILTGIGRAVQVFGTLLGGLGRVIGAVFAPLGDLFQTLGNAFEPFNDAIVDFVAYIVDAQVAAVEFIASFGPVSLIGDALGGIIGSVQQLGETITTALQPVVDMMQRIAVVASEAFSLFATAVQETFGRAVTIVSGAVESFLEFTGISSLISAFASLVTSAFNGIWEGIKNVVSSVGGFIERVVSFAETWLGIERAVETPLEPTLDLTQPSLAATQFANEIGDAATAASEFGEAGFQAALSYQTALEQIAELQADGTYTADEAKKAADLARQSFEGTLDVLEKEAEAQKKAAEEAQKAADEKVKAAERAANAAVEADRRRVDSFIQSQNIGGEDAATKAAEDLLAITRQIDEAETAIVEARAAGDAAAEQAATRRLAILDQAQAAAQEEVQFGFSTQDAEAAITDVREQLDDTFTFENFQIAPDAFTAAQDQLRQLEQDLRDKTIDPETFETAADAIRSGFEDALETAEKIADLNEKYAEQAAEIEKERLDNLNKLGPATVKANDVRTGEGAAEFLRLATGQQDPAIEEYRKQLNKLDEIKREIAKVGGTVEIVGA